MGGIVFYPMFLETRMTSAKFYWSHRLTGTFGRNVHKDVTIRRWRSAGVIPEAGYRTMNTHTFVIGKQENKLPAMASRG